MKLKKILFIGIISTLCLAGCNTVSDGPYKQGMDALASSDSANAKILLETALKEGQNEKQCYRGLGMAYLEEGDADAAISSFLNALSCSNGIIDSVDIDISYYLAVAQEHAGLINDAMETLDSIIAIRPESDIAYYLRGKLKLSKGDKSGALSDYDKAIELAPNNYDHYIRMCEDLRINGYEEESNIYIEKAIAQKSKLSDYKRGVLEYYLGSYSDARNDFENARKSNESEELDLYLGKTYEALGDFSYATSIYEDAITKYPNSGSLYNQLALLKMNAGDYQGAIVVVEQGITSGNGESIQSLMYNRVVAYENIYDFSSAKQYMEEYLQMFPQDTKARREYTFLSSR